MVPLNDKANCGRYALQVRAPTSLAAALKVAADRELMTVSEYIRRTLIDRLRQEGIDPAAKEPAAKGRAPHVEAAA